MRHPDRPALAPEAVLRWGMEHLRDLPWRRTRDPWAVLVSEMMLQQTQVARVVPKWLAFMEVFPSPAECAAASVGDVLRLWHGLGYPRRARNLHLIALEVERLGGFPADLEGLRALPGIGPYTSRAILAFALERPAAVVDTNVARVLARYVGRRLTAREAQTIADDSLVESDVWWWNQSVMELGAVVCRPTPRCDDCPLVDGCAWRGVGDDPARGSAGVSRPQAPFEGSRRQARGRLLAALVAGPVRAEDVAAIVAHRHHDELVDALLREGLVTVADGWISLP